MPTDQERAIARTEALAVAEQVGVAAGQIAVELDQVHASLRDADVGTIRPRFTEMAIAIYARNLARQVSALAGAIERLLDAV